MSIIDKIDEAVNKETVEMKVRHKLKELDSTIDDFLDILEDSAMQIDNNPTFQAQVLQLLADTTKEHGEFMMAMKRVATALDSKSQKLGQVKPVGKQSNPYGGPNPAPWGPATGAAPDAAQPSSTGDMGEPEVEELKDLNEAVDIVGRGKKIAQLFVAYRKDLEDPIASLSGRELITTTQAYENLKKLEKSYLIELNKILKELGR